MKSEELTRKAEEEISALCTEYRGFLLLCTTSAQ